MGTSFGWPEPPDFYLWIFHKDNINQSHPHAIVLKAASTEKIQAITLKECTRVINNIMRLS